MREALELAGLAVEPHEVQALATLVLAILTVPAVTAVGLLLAVGAPWFLLPMAFALPLLGPAAVLAYPEARARRTRLAAVGETPEVVNYLAMSLRVRPSLERAVAFAAEHGEGPLARQFRRVLWDVHLRVRTRIEDAFTQAADTVGPWNPDLKRAAYVVAHAAKDGSRDGLRAALDRALAIVYEGTRRRVQDYAARLRGPTTALFALGVLLPLIVGSMIPLLSLGSVSPTSFDIVDPPRGDPVPWILLLDVAFPAIAFALAHVVSSNRPDAARRRSASVRDRWALALLLPGPVAVLGTVAFPAVVPPLAGLGAAVFALAAILFVLTRRGAEERRRTEALEAEYPDALFQLGTRLAEGRGLEESLLAVSTSLRGTASGDLFGRIARAMRLGGGTADDVLFGPRGALREIPSRTVRATLRMTADLAAKDPAVAGRTALEMSGHLRDLQGVQRDLRAELRPTLDAMRATAAFFGPVVLGVTGALYGILARAFAGFASLPMEPATFEAALGVYLVLTTAAIVYFASRIEAGDDWTAFGASLTRTLPLGFGLFAATTVLAGFAL